MVVPLHEPDRYCEGEHWLLLHDVQVPLAVADAPFRNCPSEQVGWSLHLKPSVAPRQAPVRYWLAAQLMLLHVLQALLERYKLELHVPQ